MTDFSRTTYNVGDLGEHGRFLGPHFLLEITLSLHQILMINTGWAKNRTVFHIFRDTIWKLLTYHCYHTPSCN